MNLLAFDTSTDVLRVAVQRGEAAPWQHESVGGAQASSTLLPAVHALMERAGLALRDLDAIVFGAGPGSFTGLRTSCAVAQGLAFGAGVMVLPVETLLAVAEDARCATGATSIVAAIDARMDEVYWGAYVHDGAGWRREGELRLTAPERVELAPGFHLAGNVGPVYGDHLPASRGAIIDAAPTAVALLRVAPALAAAGGLRDALHATPLYIRDKVAQTTEERARLRASRPT